MAEPEMDGSHLAAAAATAFLIATGLVKPGAVLIGLIVGLAAVITVGPVVARAPFARRARTVAQTVGSTARYDTGTVFS